MRANTAVVVAGVVAVVVVVGGGGCREMFALAMTRVEAAGDAAQAD